MKEGDRVRCGRCIRSKVKDLGTLEKELSPRVSHKGDEPREQVGRGGPTGENKKSQVTSM